ncbi:hypothetical protein [Amycolatopsis echigonensis]|uniref:Uncharacterized protein n=1 Tax=Amycolatopsis echigonensis TaxID=2576905 RepID=A0A8E2B3S2_9PSEU|nr:hypothetical protein [Amycolatopsis echigonensis]
MGTSRTSYLTGTPPEDPVERNVSSNRLTLREILLHGLDDVIRRQYLPHARVLRSIPGARRRCQASPTSATA